jgi:hypothetical protein
MSSVDVFNPAVFYVPILSATLISSPVPVGRDPASATVVPTVTKNTVSAVNAPKSFQHPPRQLALQSFGIPKLVFDPAIIMFGGERDRDTLWEKRMLVVLLSEFDRT